NNKGEKYQVDPSDGIIVLSVNADPTDAKIGLEKTYEDGSVERREYSISGLLREDPKTLFDVLTPTVTDFGAAFGNKTPDDIQQDIVITEPGEGETLGKITGTLKPIIGFQGFGSPYSSGHYISFKVNAPGASSIVASFETDGEEAGIPADLTNDPDKTALMRIGNKDANILVVRVKYDEETTLVKKYDLSELVLDDFRIDTEIGADTNLLGKTIGDLQDSIEINKNSISGTLKYVEAYTGFEEGAKGHFVALHVDGVNDKTFVINNKGEKYQVDPSDGIIVLSVNADPTDAKIGLEKTYEDGSVERRVYSISGLLRLQPENPEAEYNINIEETDEDGHINLYKAGSEYTRHLKATITDSETGEPVKGVAVDWSTTDSNIATVSETGTFTDNKGQATATVTIVNQTEAGMASIGILADGVYENVTYEVYKQDNPEKTATLTFPDETEAVLSPEFILPAGSQYSLGWSVISGATYAGIDPFFGVVYARANGTAKFVHEIYDGDTVVVDSGEASPYVVTITSLLNRLYIVQDKDVFANYESNDVLHLEFDPADYDLTGLTVEWSSSNDSIAEVSADVSDQTKAKVTGKEKGAVTITATVKNGSTVIKTAKAALRVRPRIPGLFIKKVGSETAIESAYVKKGNVLKLYTDIPEGDEFADYTVSWKSSDPGVASVSSNGNVTGLKVGDVMISAFTPDGTQADVRVIVYNNIDSLTANVSNINLTAGETVTVYGIGTPEDAALDLVWTSDKENIATVIGAAGGKAMITAGADNGTAIITAMDKESGLSVTIKVSVGGTDKDLTELTAVSSEYTLYPGQTAVLAYTVKPSDYTNTVFEWSTTQSSVAVVDQRGNVTAVNAGNAEIKVTAKKIDGTDTGLYATYRITVLDAKTKSISIEPKSLTLKAPVEGIMAGETARLTAKTYPEYVVDTVTWSSDKPAVATVEPDTGLVRAQAAGTATITATSVNNAEIKQSVKVSVIESIDGQDARYYIENGAWIGWIDDYTYTGTAIKPEPNVYYGSVLLTPGIDYTYSYKNNTNAARKKNEPEVTVKLKGNYAGTVSRTFTIYPADLSENVTISSVSATAKINKKTGTYAEQLLKPILVYGTKTLRAGTDYDLYYMDDNTAAYADPGIWTITIQGKGNYSGEVFADEILADPATAVNMSTVKIEGLLKSYLYTGDSIEPEGITLRDKAGNTVDENDYEVKISNNTGIGTATILFTATNITKYYGSKKATFKIGPKVTDLSTTPISVSINGSGWTNGTKEFASNADVTYAKGGTKPSSVEVRLSDGTELVNNVDYTWKSTVDKNGGKVTITGKGKFYKKAAVVTFNVAKQDISNMTFAIDDFVYSNKADAYKKHKFNIYDVDGKALAPKTDFIVSAWEAETAVPSVGSYVTATLTGQGNYEGDATVTFKVIDKNYKLSAATYAFLIDDEEIAANKFYVKYAGTPVTITEDEIVLRVKKRVGRTVHYVVVDPSDYEIVAINNNNKVGKAVVIIKGTGEYGGLKTINITIRK
ncbi:MAG: Ig-like domain-containing protein, partial [Lachnospiraceae bacterium]|nr:Ig-like domain-containing protein [Lachnospiraceae bacterium]